MNSKTENFIVRAKNIHYNLYDYSLTIYKTSKINVTIVCPTHGNFLQRPDVHLRGSGCFSCYCDKYRKSKINFIKEANLKHNNYYNYYKSRYINDETKIEIICKIHGSFWCTPNNHLGKNRLRGCPSCGFNISKNEIIWLNLLKIKIRQYKLIINNKLYKVDGFDKDTNTIYEFLGDYWHGNFYRFDKDYINKKNKKTMASLNDEIFKRFDIFKKAGYNVQYIWESDFKKTNE